MPLTYIRTKDKFDGPIFRELIYRGRGRGLIFGRKNTSICNLLNLLLLFLFSSIKLIFWHISRRVRCEIMFQVTKKTPDERSC